MSSLRRLLRTGDGSYTITQDDITYHSRHGAVNESQVVFIDAGLSKAVEVFGKELNILECGFGTGLNALMTLQFARANGCKVSYTGLEKYPLDMELAMQTDYPQQTGHVEDKEIFFRIHDTVSYVEVEVAHDFYLTRLSEDISSYYSERKYELIYFDAFAPSAQPELWTEEVFRNMYKSLKPGGILVTYCSKSVVRKTMEAAGFKVEKLPGPKGKREIVRGIA